MLTFLYSYRQHLILRFHNYQDESFEGTTHGNQRWITCLYKVIRPFLKPALLVMYEQKRDIWDRTLGDFDRDLMDERVDIIGNAEKFVKEAVDEYRKYFVDKISPEISTNVAVDIFNKLKNVKIVLSLQKSIFPISKLEEFYEELSLNGDENYFKSIKNIEDFDAKILNEPKSSWRKNIEKVVKDSDQFGFYHIENGNILCEFGIRLIIIFCLLCLFKDLPPLYMIYPYYHPLRPKYFNMAALEREVLDLIQNEIDAYAWRVKLLNYHYNFFTKIVFILQHYRVDIEPFFSSTIQIAYEHYKKWLKNNNTELQIGANYLTNEQLFWVAYGVSFYTKYHKTAPLNLHWKLRLKHNSTHVLTKLNPGFQEAFHCNITNDEINLYEEYIQEYNKLYYFFERLPTLPDEQRVLYLNQIYRKNLNKDCVNECVDLAVIEVLKSFFKN